jgi:hypothetical protein
MQADPVSRLLLAVATLALLVLVVQGSGLGSDAEGQRGRYSMTLVRVPAGYAVLRLDTRTGELSRTSLREGEPWVALGQPAPLEEVPPEAAAEPEPAPAPEAPAAAPEAPTP